MASGFFLLHDDIATLADDVAVATKVATQKTVGILGDDIAVSAQQTTGFKQERELQVIWAIIKGSLRNKLIILPFAFLLSSFASFLIPYILIAGACYLLFEGAEKIEEYFHKQHQVEEVEQTEESKIKSAILTDFILSIEIVIIALSSVSDHTLEMQIYSVSIVAVLTTFGVYGLVALIVRIDNVGFYLIKKQYIKSGNFLISLMPKIIKALSVIGTVAMILVGGGILIHNIPFLHHFLEAGLFNSLVVGSIGGTVILLVGRLTRF